jgi:hypothetical protein
MRLLAVDPGVRSIGWAEFELWHVAPRLLSCGLARSAESADLDAFRAMAGALPGCPMQVVERPQIYQQSRSKGDPEDLARILILCGMLAQRTYATQLVLPRTWKGTIKKTAKIGDYVVHRRNKAVLGAYLPPAAEVPRSLAHNVADAVGLGLWWLRQNAPRGRG